MLSSRASMRTNVLSTTYLPEPESKLAPDSQILAIMSSPIADSRSGDIRQQTILSNLDPDAYKIYATSSAKLYHTDFGTDPTDWKYLRVKGCLVFGRDRTVTLNDRSIADRDAIDVERYWLRILDEKSGRLLWVFDIPSRWEYQRDKPFFHIFRGRSRMYGLLFEDDDEALAFSKRVMAKTRSNQTTISTRRRPSKYGPALRTVTLSPAEISAPEPDSFVHVAHIGVNERGDIETSDNIDPSWTSLLTGLAQYGVTEQIVQKHQHFVEGWIAATEAISRGNSNEMSGTAHGATATA